MSAPLRQERLANGLELEFVDLSNRYFGDYHRVAIAVRCRVPLVAELFGGKEDPAAAVEHARRTIGDQGVELKRLERMGVPSAERERVKEELIEGFCRHAMGYLEAPDLPTRLVERELTRRRKGRRFPLVTR